jgi:hypothetical protein
MRPGLLFPVPVPFLDLDRTCDASELVAHRRDLAPEPLDRNLLKPVLSRVRPDPIAEGRSSARAGASTVRPRRTVRDRRALPDFEPLLDLALPASTVSALGDLKRPDRQRLRGFRPGIERSRIERLLDVPDSVPGATLSGS